MVVNLQVHTVGGVIVPGQPLLDIVPSNDILVAEGRIKPEDINEVHPGMPAEVALTAFKQSVTPRLKGRITTVSGDRITDQKTGIPYFLMRVSIDPEERAKVADLVLTPGMPAEIYVVSKTSSAFSQLFQPFTDSLNRGFTR
ncbi:hypothetical protein WCLP8_3480002 [uncultured Gammaproteobacteria bacterium]